MEFPAGLGWLALTSASANPSIPYASEAVHSLKFFLQKIIP